MRIDNLLGIARRTSLGPITGGNNRWRILCRYRDKLYHGNMKDENEINLISSQIQNEFQVIGIHYERLKNFAKCTMYV